MRIMVTNDDGIDSIGLLVLARALQPYGEVVIIAPDGEYSGASSAIGAVHLLRPEVRRCSIDDVDEAWTVSGPPALCVLFARLGAFGRPFDLVVAGINPGANVGRSVYHSGTVGAALTARSGGVTGIAVSQHADVGGVEGQAWGDMLAHQCWDTAAAVAATVVGAIAERPLAEPSVLNLNVPNTSVEAIKGWRRTTLAHAPMRAIDRLILEPKAGHESTYEVSFSWGEATEPPIDSDAGAVAAGYVSLTWLSRLHEVDPHDDDRAVAEGSLDQLLGT